MPNLPLRVLAFALMLTIVGMASTVRDEETLRKISGYREWSRLTEKPMSIAFPSVAG